MGAALLGRSTGVGVRLPRPTLHPNRTAGPALGGPRLATNEDSDNSWLLTWCSGSVAEAGWTGGGAGTAVGVELVDGNAEVGQ